MDTRDGTDYFYFRVHSIETFLQQTMGKNEEKRLFIPLPSMHLVMFFDRSKMNRNHGNASSYLDALVDSFNEPREETTVECLTQSIAGVRRLIIETEEINSNIDTQQGSLF